MRHHIQSSQQRFGLTHRARAVSLLELLVVIAIIALMMSMLLPSLKHSMRLARDAMCMNNLRQQYSALQMYRMDNDGWLPMNSSAFRKEWLAADQENNKPTWFQNLVPDYLADPLIMTCPEDPYRFRLVQTRGQFSTSQVGDFASYGINSFIMNAGNGFLANVDRYQPTRPLDTILLADLGPDVSEGIAPVVAKKSFKPGPLRNRARLAWDDGYNAFSTAESRPWLTRRHGDGINVVTLAGNVRDARTVDAVRSLVRPFYTNCAVGGCTMCNELRLHHYSFARNNLFWWTGATPTE